VLEIIIRAIPCNYEHRLSFFISSSKCRYVTIYKCEKIPAVIKNKEMRAKGKLVLKY